MLDKIKRVLGVLLKARILIIIAGTALLGISSIMRAVECFPADMMCTTFTLGVAALTTIVIIGLVLITK